MNRQGMGVRHTGISPDPFNSEVFPRKRSSIGPERAYRDSKVQQHRSLDTHHVDDREEKHSNSGRFNSEGYAGNYVIQHRQLKEPLP